MAETAEIAEMANKVSEELFEWFKWEKIPVMDQNFDCHKKDKHFSGTDENHLKTHPVDVVFKYRDPYSGVFVYLNTDLKSYKKNSITTTQIRGALRSLACTIDCAAGSPEWKEKYCLDQNPFEVRGMLFVYNHDGEFDKAFYDLFNPKSNSKGKLSGGIDLSKIPIAKNQKIHIFEPTMINYMQTIISDMNDLHHRGSFPKEDYFFYYPDQNLHKCLGGNEKLNPATVEAITAPFLFVKHDEIDSYNEKTKKVEQTYGRGLVIYFNRNGSNEYEFVYLFDILSKFQLLNKELKIRIRVASQNPDKNIQSKYKKAINIYSRDWNFDDNKKSLLDNIEFKVITRTKSIFSTHELAWR